MARRDIKYARKSQIGGTGSTTLNNFRDNGDAAELLYNGSTKLATTNTGVDVTGTLTADGATITGTLLAAQSGAGANAFAAGVDAGTIAQSTNAVSIGYRAGENTQGTGALAIGAETGRTTQGQYALSMGAGAGTTNQGQFAVSLGNNSGNTGQNASAVAIGVNSAQYNQGTSSVAIGNQAGQGSATPGDEQGDYAIAVGYQAGETGQVSYSVAIGNQAGQTSQASNAVSLGNGAGSTNQSTEASAFGLNAGNTGQGRNALAFGSYAGQTNQGEYAVAIGALAGQGFGASPQSDFAIAIGSYAGRSGQGQGAIAIGRDAGNTSQGANGIIISSKGSAVDDTTAGHIHLESSAASLVYDGSTWAFLGGTDISVPGTVDGRDIASDGTTQDSHIADATLHFTEGSIDHGSIAGLADDDHTQYLLVDGTRALTDNLLFSDATGAVIDVTTNSSTLTIQGRDSLSATNTLGFFDPDGTVEFYYDGDKVFSTINDSSSYDGVRIRGISGSERPSVVLTDSAGVDKAVFAAWSDNHTYFDNRVDPATGGGDFVLRTANHTGATILNATLTLKAETGNGANDERILVKHGNTDTVSTYNDGSGPGLSVFGTVPSIWLGDDDSMTNPYFFLRRAGSGKVNMRAMNPTDNFDITTRTGDELSHDIQIRMHAETGVDTFDANVALYYNNSIALRTTDSGIYVRDRGGDDPRISMLDSTDVTKFRIEHVGGIVSKLVGMEHGVPVQIRAENNSGTETTCLQVDPDAEVGLFHAGTKVLRTIAPGVVVGDQGGAAGDQFLKIIADNDNTVEAANAYIQLEQDGAAVISQIGTTGNANTMPDGTAITIGSGSGIKANSLALINKFSTGSIGFVVGSTAELIIDSTGCAFNGKTPVAVPTYTVTNDVTDRTYDANSTSVAELADVLGTLIADLQANGLLN